MRRAIVILVAVMSLAAAGFVLTSHLASDNRELPTSMASSPAFSDARIETGHPQARAHDLHASGCHALREQFGVLKVQRNDGLITPAWVVARLIRAGCY